MASGGGLVGERVRGAMPSAWMRVTSAAMREMPLVNSPESVGYLMSAGPTVVSARSQPMSITPATTPAATSCALSASTVHDPHRVVIFISVERCGARSPSGIRQNRNQVSESDTSAHSDS